MASKSGNQITERLNVAAEGHDQREILSHPFICGICREKFDQLRIFINHFTTHNTICNKHLHVCKCLYAGDVSTDSDTEHNLYICRICKNKFTSICTLHSHILHCSSDGSYIFDNTRKMVYPLTLHCSYSEAREGDNCERADVEAVDLSEKNDSSVNMDFNSNGMSKAEKVDYILRNVCSLYGNNEKKEFTEKKKVVRKRRRSGKYENCVSVVNSGTLDGKNIENVALNDTKVYKGGNNESGPDTEHVDKVEEDHIIIKVEVEEKNSCDKTYNNTGMEDGRHREGKENTNDFNAKFPDKLNDDENDLTDEYTPPVLTDECIQSEKKNIKKKISPAKRVKMARLKKKMSPREMQKKQRAVEECPHCGKWLKPYKLKIHLVSHTEDRPFKCDQCPKAYKYQSHLESHRHAHEEVKPFYCEKCGKGYTTITMLKHHSMMHHADSKPCVCSLCGASFITNYKLKRHMMKHTGEKCVQCDLCGMGFATRYNLSVHIQGVHKRNLRFTCKECGRNFMTNYQHKVHMMKHSGERPYKCIICRAEYIERKELRRHLKKQHSLMLEGNSSALSELMDGCISEKLNTSKVAQERSTFTGQTYNQVQEQREAGTAADFIEMENENVYSYTNADLCQSAPYYPSMKTAREITNLKGLPTSDFQIDYSHAQDYSFNNSAVDHGVPLTVQERQGYSRYHYTLNDHCMAKDLSKSKEDKFDTSGSAGHGMHANDQLVHQEKNRTDTLHSKIDRKFTVL